MMKVFKATAALFLLSTVSSALPHRDERVISLFNVVTFQNDECQSTKDKDNKGTCFSSTECNNKGGTAEGNCAAGFGVCCIIRITTEAGGDVTHNNTIIESKNYPTAYTVTTAASASYKIKPIHDNICFIRYDFIDFDLLLTTSTGVCTDTFAVAVPSNAGTSPPNVCGYNNGHHMYSDNMMSTSDTTLTISTSTTALTTRKWKVKISQIGCDCPTKPTVGCHQYFTEPTGVLESFNHGATTQLMIPGSWTICMRQNKGKCGTNYATDPTVATGGDNFDLVEDSTTAGTAGTTGRVWGADCNVIKMLFDKVTGITKTQLNAANGYIDNPNGIWGYCGTHLNNADDSAAEGLIVSKGFKASVVNIVTTDVHASKGFKIRYTQTPC